MIGGMVMILVAVWIYQSAVKANTGNVIYWVAGCAAVFLASQVLLIQLNYYISEAFTGGSDIGGSYERDITEIGDRKNMGGFQGASGRLMSTFLELMPPTVGFLIIAAIRVKFITKEGFSAASLFGGLKEMFVAIKQSFKAPQ